jgi:nucleoside-diphosphate-sugar epimerase
MKKMKILVTGGAGFIGSNLVDVLLKQGHDVLIIDDLSTGKQSNLNPLALHYKVALHEALVEDLVEILTNVEVVYHTAALARVQPSIQDPVRYNEANVTSIVKLLTACVSAGVRRIVYSASSSAYGNATIFPTPETHFTDSLSPYGLQKYIGELYCKMYSKVYGIDTVCLRYFNIYGPRMNFEGAYKTVIGVFAEQTKNGIPMTITNDGNQRRDFTYVKDVVSANILAGNSKETFVGDVFNIGNGGNVSINEVADMIGDEKVYGEIRLEPFETLADNNKAKAVLGWEPKGNLHRFIKEELWELDQLKNYTKKL